MGSDRSRPVKYPGDSPVYAGSSFTTIVPENTNIQCLFPLFVHQDNMSL